MADGNNNNQWQRARTPQQKDHRISEIIEATARLYKKHHFDEISLSLIAKEASFTRSNLYKYFSSKEEIFLEFLGYDLEIWSKDLFEMSKGRENLTIEGFVSIWKMTLLRHKQMLDLLSIMNVILEKNVSEEKLVKFKTGVNALMFDLSELIVRLLPQMSMEKAGDFLQLQMTSLVGIYQVSNLSDVQERVLSYPEFRHMKIELESSIEKSITYLLRGMLG